MPGKAEVDRLRSLMRANAAVVEELDLAAVLRRIVDAALELVGARYGALGVISPDGRLEQFIHAGMPEEDAARIAHLPEGHGLLGAVIDSADVIRLPELSADARSVGFPDHHPAMSSFLGVPIRVGAEVYGNLYLTEHPDGVFTEQDEELVTSLAATAGIAIANARLFAESERRRRWSAVVTEVTSALLSGSADVLGVIADRAGSVVDADLVSVIVPTADPAVLRVALARGRHADEIEGREFAAAGSVAGRVLDEGAIVSSEVSTPATEAWQPELGPSIAIPLRSGERALGVLTLARRPGAARFGTADLTMASEFAAQTGVALELGRAREDRERLELVGERGRIARDLHDNVIQRLFGTGLGLQSLADEFPARTQELLRHVESIDAAIADIRTAVFALNPAPTTGTRHLLLGVATELAPALGFSPRMVFSGPVDLLVSGGLADDVVAVAREGLANIARHAAASTASVEVSVDDRVVTVVIADDGVGMPAGAIRRSGTANLADRAARRGGTVSIAPGDGAGTRLTWTGLLEAEGRG